MKLDNRVILALLRGQTEDHIIDLPVLDEVDDALHDEVPYSLSIRFHTIHGIFA